MINSHAIYSRLLVNLLVKLSRILVNLLVNKVKLTRTNPNGGHGGAPLCQFQCQFGSGEYTRGEARTLGVSQLDWLDYELDYELDYW